MSSTAPLQIAQIVFSLQPGGMENGVANLSNGLPESTARTTILCLEEAGAFAARLRPDVKVQALGRRPGWDWGACWRLALALHRLRPDVIHTHNLGPLIYADTARHMLPTLWRIPIFHGEHGALQGDGLNPKRLQQRRRLYRRCRLVHTVSDGLRQDLIAHGLPSEKMISILNGVDCQRFRPTCDRSQAKQACDLPEDALVIGAVGRFIATKRYPLLIEAFESLAQDHPRLHLMILGDSGPERENVHQIARQSPVATRIHLKGHQAEPAPFYQAMDLLAMPSSHEGLANALLEAMASGVPALAHAACGAAEVIDDGVSGFLAHIDSAADLAQKISSLIQVPGLLQQVSAKARQAAQEKFSLDSMVKNYLAAFHRVAGRTP
jgi:glycosyltransferase involved in cell wall biosynthesis